MIILGIAFVLVSFAWFYQFWFIVRPLEKDVKRWRDYSHTLHTEKIALLQKHEPERLICVSMGHNPTKITLSS